MENTEIDWKFEASKDREMIDNFSMIAQAKMARNRENGRYGWWDPQACSKEYLSNLLMQHVMKGDPVDVAIIAMMISVRGEKITL